MQIHVLLFRNQKLFNEKQEYVLHGTNLLKISQRHIKRNTQKRKKKLYTNVTYQKISSNRQIIVALQLFYKHYNCSSNITTDLKHCNCSSNTKTVIQTLHLFFKHYYCYTNITTVFETFTGRHFAQFWHISLSSSRPSLQCVYGEELINTNFTDL